jgi:hypothetical protein
MKKQTRQLKHVPVDPAPVFSYDRTNAVHDVYTCPRTAAEQLVNLVAAFEYNEARDTPEGGTPGQRFRAFQKQAFAMLAQARYETARDRLLERIRVPGEGA